MRNQTRKTRQRAIILEELQKSVQHPTAEEIYASVRQRLPQISLGTVYRNLDLLAESGQIRKLETSGNCRRFDGNISPHQHVHCKHCGKIGDIFATLDLPAAGTLKVKGFASIGNAHIVFDGICDICNNSKNRDGAPANP